MVSFVASMRMQSSCCGAEMVMLELSLHSLPMSQQSLPATYFILGWRGRGVRLLSNAGVMAAASSSWFTQGRAARKESHGQTHLDANSSLSRMSIQGSGSWTPLRFLVWRMCSLTTGLFPRNSAPLNCWLAIFLFQDKWAILADRRWWGCM